MEQQLIVKICNTRAAKNRKEIRMPIYATPGAAGADLFACLERDLIIKPGERAKIPTGIAMEIPDNLVGLVFARSGLASKKGLTLSNGVGVIDSDYRGEIMVLVINQGHEDVIIHDGERIAQIIFLDVLKASFKEVENLDVTLRGDKGFGSTGLK
ncbi:MAG: dUTP diphosphatase [Peptococcaceae bacterium]|nr:dUTP diphosphatase [Peptococcaceae bacterium]